MNVLIPAAGIDCSNCGARDVHAEPPTYCKTCGYPYNRGDPT